MTRLIIITEIPSHYRLPVFNKIAMNKNISLFVIYLKENIRGRSWNIMWNLNKFDYAILKSLHITRADGAQKYISYGLVKILKQKKPDVIICDGYNHTASIQALIFSRKNKIRCLLRSESNDYDRRNNYFFVELYKRFMVKNFSGFIASGLSSKQYLKSLGANKNDIWIAPDSVENNWYERKKNHNPDNITKFLFVGRIMEHKGIFNLIKAFGSLDNETLNEVHLTFIGDGDKIDELKNEIRKTQLENVTIVDFLQPKVLAKEYSKHDVFIMPTLSDPWGLVVNEAMASGLPIICSDRAGSARDLVISKWNGYTYDGSDFLSLKSIIEKVLDQKDLIETMGNNSLKLIKYYSSENSANGFINAVLNKHNNVEDKIKIFREKNIGIKYK